MPRFWRKIERRSAFRNSIGDDGGELCHDTIESDRSRSVGGRRDIDLIVFIKCIEYPIECDGVVLSRERCTTATRGDEIDVMIADSKIQRWRTEVFISGSLMNLLGKSHIFYSAYSIYIIQDPQISHAFSVGFEATGEGLQFESLTGEGDGGVRMYGVAIDGDG